MRLLALATSTCLAFGSVGLTMPIDMEASTELSPNAVLSTWEANSEKHTQRVLGLNALTDVSPTLPSDTFDAITEIDSNLSGYYFYSPERDRQVLALPADYLEDSTPSTRRASASSKVHDYVKESLSLVQPESGQVELRVSRFTSEEIDRSMEAVRQALLDQDIPGSIDYDPWTDSLEVGVNSTSNFLPPNTALPIHIVAASVTASVENRKVNNVRGGLAQYRKNLCHVAHDVRA